jgi:hypothetical protein
MTNPRTTDHIADLVARKSLEVTFLPDGSAVALDIANHRALSLSITGAFILSQVIDGVLEPADIQDRIVSRFDVEPATAATDLSDFLAELDGILRTSADAEAEANGSAPD